MYNIDKTKLIGRRILKVRVSTEQDALILDLDNHESATFVVHGDCCSNSWIEHHTIPELGGTITDIDEPFLEPHDDPTQGVESWETIRVYHTAFRTTKGDLIVEYRNSSNGYYGGWMSGPTITKNPTPPTLHSAFH